jgi:hypothetical protein
MPPTAAQPPAGPGSPVPTPPVTDASAAAQQVGGKLLGQGAGAGAGWGFKSLLSTEAGRMAAQVLVVDAVAGAWDLGLVPWIRDHLGIVGTSGNL